MRKTQGEKILARLKTGRCVDPITALNLFGCNRLAARIKELRDAGYWIDTRMTTVHTRAGKTRIAVYRLDECHRDVYARRAA